jgi:hypothetical protein
MMDKEKMHPPAKILDSNAFSIAFGELSACLSNFSVGVQRAIYGIKAKAPG